MKTEVIVTHSLDSTGDPIVSIPLTNVEKSVTMYQQDFNDLYERGLDPRFRLSLGIVFERGRTSVAIARLITEAKQGERVRYLDGDSLNLKRTNLVKTIGTGKSKTIDKLIPLNRPHKFNDTVSLKHIYIDEPWKITNHKELTIND